MAHTCSECTYLKATGDWPDIYGYFWCEKYNEKVYATKLECSSYCTAYSRNYSVAQSYIDYSNKHSSSSGCFITTIVCEILNLNDNNFYLNVLRNFRNNYLQKYLNTIKILDEYDFVGPIIANKLRNDIEKTNISNMIFLNYIIPITDKIIEKDYVSAIKKYTVMTKKLISRYNLGTLELTVPHFNKYDYDKDYSSYGHGFLVRK